MERVPVDSEALRSVGYKDGTLEIEFTNGSVYQYFDVPEHVHDELMRAGSHGELFSRQIRGHFRYARV
jgi:KTSC domain